MLNPIKPKILEIFIGRKVKQHHDEQHFAKRKFARSIAPTGRRNEVLPLPNFIKTGKIIESNLARKCEADLGLKVA